MMAPLDPLNAWLGIPPSDQPPDPYSLLGVKLFERDIAVILAAADRRAAQIGRYQIGAHAAVAQRLLDEIAAAKECLLTPDKRSACDQQLRRRLIESLYGQRDSVARTENERRPLDTTEPDDEPPELLRALTPIAGAEALTNIIGDDEEPPDLPLPCDQEEFLLTEIPEPDDEPPELPRIVALVDGVVATPCVVEDEEEPPELPRVIPPASETVAAGLPAEAESPELSPPIVTVAASASETCSSAAAFCPADLQSAPPSPEPIAEPPSEPPTPQSLPSTTRRSWRIPAIITVALVLLGLGILFARWGQGGKEIAYDNAITLPTTASGNSPAKAKDSQKSPKQ